MNKCSLNEFDSFQNVFSSINHKNEKWKISNSKIILCIKNLPDIFPRTPLTSQFFQCYLSIPNSRYHNLSKMYS